MSLQQKYEEKITAGLIIADDEQREAVRALGSLLSAMQALPQQRAAGFFGLLFSSRQSAIAQQQQGAYLYGGVGRGKSMVMDLFFQQAPIKQKRRVHFHAFMLEVHDFLHQQRQRREHKPAAGLDDDLMACAAHIATQARLLCFDEFQVRDVADAMILGRLFTALFEHGVYIIMTSNIPPDALYEDGLQRDRFLPFIALLKSRTILCSFTGDKDYRLGRLRGKQVYFWPDDADARAELEKIFCVLSDGEEGAAADIVIKERVLHVPRCFHETAWFSFSELCETPKSALDYLALCRRFRVFIVTGVPLMNDAHRDVALRFVTFVDTVYEHHSRLVLTAATLPEKLYKGEFLEAVFARTASRLHEMQARDYLL